MDRDPRLILGRVVIGLGCLWCGFVAWHFLEPDPEKV